MHKATITYHAPKGDSKVVEIFGATLYDGKPDDVILDDRQLGKMQNNPLFKVGKVADYDPAKDKEPDKIGDKHK